jgi:hypothetical protein
MDNRVQPDFSAGLEIGDQTYIVDRMYDHIHVFSWLGHGILKLITEDGVAQIHLSQANALKIATGAGIVPIMREEISEREYNQYLSAQEGMLDDDWLDI